MSVPCCSATLIILGEALDPALVSELLGLSADAQWRRGEQKRSGQLVFDSVHEWGGWKRFIPAELRDAELQEQLEHWIELLAPREAALQRLAARGYELELNCFTASSAELYLAPALLARLASWGVGLSLHVMAD